MSAPLIFNGRRAKMLTQDGILRADGSIIDNNGTPNLIKNGHAEINVTGWTVSKNTVAASRPDSGFVTSSTNITWTRNTTNPIDGQADFLYTKDAANRQGQQVYCGFTVAKKHRAKVLQIEVDYLVNSGTFSAGSSSTDSDVIVYIYDVTNSTFIEPSSFKFLSNSSTIADKFVANFQTSATGSSYRILFHQATTSSSAFAVQFKEVRVSPCNYVYGTPITDWVSYTPTFGAGFGTVSTSSFYSRRVGDSLQVKGKWTNGTVAGSAATITVGYAGSNANVTIDTSKVSASGIVGTAQTSLASTTQFGVYPIAPSSNGTAISFTVQNSTTAFGSGAQNGNIIAASGSQNSIEFEVPIVGWSSSVQQSDGYDGRIIAARYSTSSSSAINTSSSVVVYGTKEYDTTNSYNSSTGVYVVPSSGYYKISAAIHITNYTTKAPYLEVLKSGTSVMRLAQSYFNGGLTTGSSVFQFNAGDNVQINGAIWSGSNDTLNGESKLNYFTIEKLSSPQTMSATEVVAASYIVDGGGQSLTSTAVLQFNTKVFDTHNAVTTGASWKFTAPYQGIYRLSYKMMQVNNTGTSCQIAMRKNAAPIYRSQPAAIVNGPSTVVSNQMMQADSVLFSLNSGDYIDVYINSAAASGSVYTATSDSWINIERIK